MSSPIIGRSYKGRDISGKPVRRIVVNVGLSHGSKPGWVFYFEGTRKQMKQFEISSTDSYPSCPPRMWEAFMETVK